MVSLSDAALLKAVQARDGAAIDQLLSRYEQRVYRFGLRMCGNEADARDVLQETLLAAFRHLDGFREQASLSTWLYQVARSFCIKQRRRTVGEPARLESMEAHEVQQLVDQHPAADARAHAAEMGRLIQQAMLALPAEQREVLVLRDVEGLSAEEAAAVLELEVGALKSRLHRARMALKNQLATLLKEPADSGACPDLQLELAAYAASEIDQAACERLEKHLSTCPQCSAACDSLKRSVSMCRQLPGGKVPDSVREAVRSALVQLTLP